MAKKRETTSGSKLLKELQRLGWFRNISDRVQVGIPDFIGCYCGVSVGLEVKAVSEVVPSGWAPSKSEHRFSEKQVEELKSICQNGGVGIGVVICGNVMFAALPSQINDAGQINCRELKMYKLDEAEVMLRSFISEEILCLFPARQLCSKR